MSYSNYGELRQDIVTNKWVAIATQRSNRPSAWREENRVAAPSQKYNQACPFCNLAKFPQEKPTLRLPENDNWQVQIFPNKYPAFSPSKELKAWQQGQYRTVSSTGYHELLTPKYHNHIDGLLSEDDFSLQLEVLVLRYRQLKAFPHVNHIQIIKNHGAAAGASVIHPHHQIFAIPVLPSDIKDMLEGAEKYAQANNGKSVYTTMMQYERESGQRIVAENDFFTAFCPYASRLAFETWIMPRKEDPFFDDMGPQEREALASIMKQVFGKLYHGLKNPPYNYHIHSAPCDENGFVCSKETFSNFRWHIQITPRLSHLGGLEISTGLEINPSSPEEVAEFLREQPIS